MSDTTDTTQQENTTQQESGKDLRTRFETQLTEIQEKNKAELEKIAREKAELQEKLDAIAKAEEEKNKTLEEKLAEAKKTEEELKNRLSQTEKQAQLDKALLKENINPEFIDLINREGINLYSEESTVDDVIGTLKTKYPSAFTVTSNRPSNVGSPTNASSNEITKEQAIEMVKNPELYRKHREAITKALYS